LAHVGGGQNIRWLAFLNPFAENAGRTKDRWSDGVSRYREFSHHIGKRGGQTAGGEDAQWLSRCRIRGEREQHSNNANEYTCHADLDPPDVVSDTL
jgi:general stress protein YciG